MVVDAAVGYVASNFSKRGVKFFASCCPPWGPDLPTVYTVLNGLHVATAGVQRADRRTWRRR
jgi:cytochrome b561